MRRWTALAAALAFTFCLAAPVLATGHEDDLKVIKRAVRGGHDGDPGKPVKWFKILITDNSSRTSVVKVTLPISLAKFLTHCSKDRHLHTEKRDIDLAAAMRNLEELTPLTLLEIVDDDATIKIWLE